MSGTARAVTATADFLSALHPSGSGISELRALPSKATAFVNATDTDAIQRFLQAHAKENLYVGIATRRKMGDGSLANCGELHALFVDLDFKRESETGIQVTVERFPLKSSMIVKSGGGLHLYWLLREPMELQTDAARAKDLLRRLALALGGDLNAAEPARILRVPGTLNHKYSQARQVVIEHFDSELRYNPSDFDDFLPEEPTANGNGHREHFTVPEAIRDGERNDTFYRLARSLKARGMSQAATLAAVKVENSTRCAPPLEEGEIEEIICKAYQQADRPEFSANNGNAGATTSPPGATVTHRQAPSLQTVPLSALLAVPDEPVPYLVERLVVAEANGWIGGEPKSLKSWLALYLGLCLAIGISVFGRYAVPEPVRVLYIQEEDGERRVRRRIRQILVGLGVVAPSDAYFRLSIKAGLLLDDPQWLEALRAEIDAFRPALVIADVFELLHTKDSDKRAELKSVFYGLDRLREQFGCGFLMVDHFKKASVGSSKRGGQRLAGTVGKHAWGESSVYLFPGTQKNRVRVETELKDGPCEKFNLTLEDTEDDGVGFLWEAEEADRAADMKAQILEALSNDWMTTKQIAETCGVSPNTASKWLNALADEDKQIEKDRRSVGKVRPWHWRLRG